MARSSVRPSKIASPVLDVLSRSVVREGAVYLPPEKLDRNLYRSVNDVLEALGGTWTTKAKSHVFDAGLDVPSLLEAVVATGEYVAPKDILKAFNFFRSPKPVVDEIIDRLGLFNRARVLEPSAGDGAIADGVRAVLIAGTIHVVELQDDLRVGLTKKGYEVIGSDFLALDVEKLEFAYDRVAMNPPFRGQADIAHVMHALTFLRPGGRLVAVMSAGVRFRQDTRSTSFRTLLFTLEAEVDELPEGSFLESGTAVQTIIVTIDKPSNARVGEILPR